MVDDKQIVFTLVQRKRRTVVGRAAGQRGKAAVRIEEGVAGDFLAKLGRGRPIIRLIVKQGIGGMVGCALFGTIVAAFVNVNG